MKDFLKRVSKNPTDVRWRENIFRSLPSVVSVVKKQRLLNYAADLVHRPRLSLVRDFWIFSGELVPTWEEDCQLFLCLSGGNCGQGVFFRDEYPASLLSLNEGETGLLLGFSSTGLPIY
ncbi:putative divalent cation-dependent regulator A [Chlamydia ibidis]|nr:putative divalent cation-dependent regulator A [Chlamydia ibidis]